MSLPWNPLAGLLINHGIRLRPIIALPGSVKSEDSLGAHRRIGKAIRNVKIRLDDPRDREAFSRWCESSRYGLLCQGPAT
jgi:hypothetical protein